MINHKYPRFLTKQGKLLLFCLFLVLGQVNGAGTDIGVCGVTLKPWQAFLPLPATLNGDPETSLPLWTFMLYMDGDNNLEQYALDDFLEASSSNLSESVKVLIQLDRISGYSIDYEDWKICHRFVLSPHMTPDESNAISDWGDGMGGREVNMGDPQTLADFVNWGMIHYPASHYAVILWDHGNGWRSAPKTPMRSLCYDSTSNDSLYTPEMREAFENVPLPFDIIGFDACLMGMVEVAYEIRNEGRILISSEAKIPVDGWPYDLIFQDLCTTPTLTPRELAKIIVRRYGESYNMDYTLSAVDLTQMESLGEAIHGFSSSLLENNQHWACVADAKNLASFYDDSEEFRDLGGVVQGILECATDDIIRNKAEALWDALDTVTLALQFPTYLPSYGLSIYFPDPHQTSIDAAYICSNIQSVCDTGWDEILYALQKADIIPPDIQHTPLSDTLVTSGPYHLEAFIQDESGIRDAVVYFRKNGGAVRRRAMKEWNGTYVQDIPGPSAPGDHYCYRIEARDIPGNVAYFPGPYSRVFWCFDIGEESEGLWEQYDGITSLFDLSNKRVTFLPDPLDPKRYQCCLEERSDWSVSPEGGAPLFLGDDAFVPVALHTAPVYLYGNPSYNLYVGSNGYITFTQGDTEYYSSLFYHFSLERISPCFTDLNPSAGGSISYREMQDRIVFTFQDIQEWGKTQTNNFQVELFYYGSIRLTYLKMTVEACIIGLSDGQGIPGGLKTDFSTIGSCPAPPPPSIEIETPGGSLKGYISIPYTLYDENANPADMQVFYTKEGGSVWIPGTDAPKGEGRWGLESAQEGMDHIYLWNSLLDLGNGQFENVKISLIPYNMHGAGSAQETGFFSVFNPSRAEIKEYLLYLNNPMEDAGTRLDVNKDGIVDIADMIMVIQNDL